MAGASNSSGHLTTWTYNNSNMEIMLWGVQCTFAFTVSFEPYYISREQTNNYYYYYCSRKEHVERAGD